MSYNNRPIFKSIRILTEDPEILDRKTGLSGEIYVDPTHYTLKVFDGATQGGIEIARSDLANVSETDFVSLATSSRLFGPNIHIHNTVVNSNSISGDKDYVTFTVGTNDITALYLTKYVGVDLKAFFAIQEGDAWTAGQDVNQMLTYGHLGPWDPSLAVGSNILAGNPLHPGAVTLAANTTYTIWIQQTGSNITEYAISTNPYWVPATADLPANYSNDPVNPTILYQDGAGQGVGEADRLVNGNLEVVLEDDGTITIPTGGRIGNVQGQEPAFAFNGVDLYAPTTVDYVQLNYNNEFFSYVERKADTNFGYFVADLGAGNNWVLDGETKTTSFPAFTFPGTDGSANQYLQTNGSGTLSWVSVPNGFATIAVAGQSSVAADSATDTLTLAASTGIEITTNAGTDTVTIASTLNTFSTVRVAGQTDIEADSAQDVLTIVGSGINVTTSANTLTLTTTSNVTAAFTTMAVAGQSSVVADNEADTVTLVAGPNITISTSPGTDTITIGANVGGSSSIQSITLNNPIVIATTAAHNLGNGQQITITDVVGTTELNGNSYFADVVTSTQIRLYSDTGLTTTVNGTAGFTAYVSGGSIAATAGSSGVSTANQYELAYYFQTGNVIEGTTGLSWNGSRLSVTGDVSVTGSISVNGESPLYESTRKRTQFFVAADDSTIRTVSEDESIKFIGGTGITTASDAEGNITITGTDQTLAFQTIAVDGQTSVVADSATDTLTLVAGTGVAITTNASTDTITVTNSSPNIPQNVFSTVNFNGTDYVADTTTDTLRIDAGRFISMTHDAANDTVSVGVATDMNWADLSSIGAWIYLGDGMTIDKVAFQAITRLHVTNIGQIYYFDTDGQYTGANPTIYAISGTTIAFNLNVNGHPFLIQNSGGTNYSTGLVHVFYNGVVSTGAAAQGKIFGTLYWKIPANISGTYRYQCSAHALMQGNIVIKDIAAI
jgi:plastocyanin